MEAVGVGAWSAFQSVLTKQVVNPHSGLQLLRVTAQAAATIPQAFQNILTIGRRYHVTGWARSDGVCLPQVRNSPGIIWTGTNSINWQRIDVIFTATHANLAFNFSIGGAVGTEYVEFDDTVAYEF